MNPYQTLLDDPERMNSAEHVGEVNAGGAIPWHQPNPSPMFFGPETCPTMRERLARDE